MRNELKKRGKTQAQPGMLQVRVRGALLGQLRRLSARNESSLSEEVRGAIRRHLEEAGLWPVSSANG